VEIGGSIEALNAPFYVNSIRTGSVSELVDDAGVNIEGILFKDSGFPLALTNEINEYTEGQGVIVDGCLLRDGGLIAEGALVSTNPRGSIDLMTVSWRFPSKPLRNGLFTPELQWQSRGKWCI
jgi:hypothetical protein